MAQFVHMQQYRFIDRKLHLILNQAHSILITQARHRVHVLGATIFLPLTPAQNVILIRYSKVRNVIGREDWSSFLVLRRHSHWASPRETHGNVSWVVSTPRSPAPASLHLLALQIKPRLPDLRVPDRPLFTPSLLVLIQLTRRGRKGLEFDR